MIKIIDTFAQINDLFEDEKFILDKWKTYMNSIYDNAAKLVIDDMKDCLDSGDYVYEKDILPIINAVYRHPDLELLYSSFCRVTEGLNKKVLDCFGHDVDIDIVLYVGLCNGAGWVTNINDRDVILLGVEKILELNWLDEASMCGLIYHELGHAYHTQYGDFNQQSDISEQNFVWQLFTEGIAMYFEQILVNDFNYYHQDKNGWLEWCDNHFSEILADFRNDLEAMTKCNQRYFGDWVSYSGKGVLTKAPIYAVERIKAIQKVGFIKSEHLLIGKTGYAYDGYWTF